MKFISNIVSVWVQIRDMYLYFFRHAIIVNGYVDDHTWQGIRHRNWGDDLNYYFIRELTGRPVIMYHNFLLARWLLMKNYFCVGTVLDNKTSNSSCNANSIVWGTGCVGVLWNLPVPREIYAVRGPETEDFLNKYNIKCPKVYGDPALLLPLVYNLRERFKVTRLDSSASSQGSRFKASPPALPHREGALKKYHLGIIPHVVDLHHPVVEEIREKHADEILIIDLAHYKKWTDVIDQIYSCDRIISSSLHGLIVSDAYQVPNCWIELSGKIAGGNFKYNDYASSVNRCFAMPIHIEKYANIANLVKHAEIYFSCAKPEKIKELQDGLIKVAPFKLVAFQHGRD